VHPSHNAATRLITDLAVGDMLELFNEQLQGMAETCYSAFDRVLALYLAIKHLPQAPHLCLVTLGVLARVVISHSSLSSPLIQVLGSVADCFRASR
jgi:hypothetical protein